MVQVDIDIEDYLDQVSDAEIIREANRRNIHHNEELLKEAYSALVACNDVATALTLLERALFPTHASAAAALEKYRYCMNGRKRPYNAYEA